MDLINDGPITALISVQRFFFFLLSFFFSLHNWHNI